MPPVAAAPAYPRGAALTGNVGRLFFLISIALTILFLSVKYIGTAPPQQPADCPVCPPPSESSTHKSSGGEVNTHGSGDASCPWEFVRYKSSPWEQMWVDHVKEWEPAPCKRYHLDGNEEKSERLLESNKKWKFTQPTETLDPEIYSTFEFRKTCNGEIVTTHIEPLTLTTRHPYFCTDPGNYITDTNHLYIDWTMSEQVKDSKGRVFYFDLGATTWKTGQNWFIRQLETRGLEPDGLWAWEITQFPATQVYGEMPEKYWGVYHWYNMPASAKLNHPSNPLFLIEKYTKPEDFVVLKLDIDFESLEATLVNQMMDNPKVAKLIDLMYYEYHMNIVELDPWWDYFHFNNTLPDLYDTLIRLRKFGIRLHSWV